jgi:hypothetical protein
MQPGPVRRKSSEAGKNECPFVFSRFRGSFHLQLFTLGLDGLFDETQTIIQNFGALACFSHKH